MESNCKVLINSQRILMENDPEYTWRDDQQFLDRWNAENYGCDRFYDKELVLGFWNGDERFE